MEPLPINNNRQIRISSAGSRKSTYWPAQSLYWSELVDRLKTPARGTETLEEYLKLTKGEQDALKDVGGFVAGTLEGNRRKANNVIGRDVLTLDLDNIPAGGTQDTLRRVEALGCAYCVYSTRKHSESKPRLRVLIPLDRTATADEYEPLARKLAGIIGIEMCDPSTFEASRLMYWPSCCLDSQYVYQYGDKAFLSADALLDQYKNWRNVAEWPEVPGTQQTHIKLAAKQGDPTTKTGIVGAFCRVFDIYQAMDTFLLGVYTPCDDSTERYTYTGGSTTGGAVVYDNGLFLFSHHATDPTSGKLVNAFDLVRLHKFGERDDDAKPETPVNKIPSYAAMCELALSDNNVTALLNRERYEKATQDFNTLPEDNTNWMLKLQVSPTTGVPVKTIENVRLVLEHDPLLRGRICKDTFADSILGIAPLPWGSREGQQGVFHWKDDDDAGLRAYIEKILGFRSRDIIEDALRNHTATNGFDPVVGRLNSLEWDGGARLDNLYIDYLGAEDCDYTRAVTRKALTAAVARAMTPGCKFDYMTVVCGKQGIGKSTLFAKLGLDWFSDSIKTFEGKDAAELLQGVWIVEIGELEAFSKTDIKIVKQFLSKRDDQYRAAYARKTEKHLRRCVFFGTTNDHDYLRDTTGNRRFWPIDCWVTKPVKSIFDDLDTYEVEQVWAEAVVRWRLGETLFLAPDMEEEAERRRATHLERDPLQGQIEDFLDRPVPLDWQKWSLDRRRMFWGGGMNDTIKVEPRDRVCAMEIWRECLCDSRTNIPRVEAHRINAILEALPDWWRAGAIRFGAGYGMQKGFRRADNVVIQNVNQVWRKCQPSIEKMPVLSTKSEI